MKIAVDLRSLQSGKISGVENYILNLLEELLKQDKENNYLLFYNSWSKKKLQGFDFVNSHIKITRFPNKILNILFKLKLLRLEKLIGDFDLLFLPNLNQFCVKPNVKVVITVHDLSPIVLPEFYNFKRRLWHKFLNYKKSFLRANTLLAVSEFTKQDLINYLKVLEPKIKVIYPGVDNQIFAPSIPLEVLRNFRNNSLVPGQFLLFLNSIEPRKNLINLITAFERLEWDGSLVIAGGRGWKNREIFKRIENSPKKNKIFFLGFVKEQDKPALIKLASALVYPSFYEGFGFQPLEAASCGVPVLASSVSALPEVAGEFALLVNPYEIESIYFGLNEIIFNENLRQQLVKKGLATVIKFNWQKTAKETLASFIAF